ncbi:6-bladed beta-propeller [Puteibacter caeruleilacunae]|nr:6-bladed beta-propeller [Puteibacter caeruleilacunae]
MIFSTLALFNPTLQAILSLYIFTPRLQMMFNLYKSMLLMLSNKNLAIACSVLILLIQGCTFNSDNQFKVIPVDTESQSTINLSDISDKVEVIKFETNDSCLISNPIYLKVTSKYVFVTDGMRRVLQFDRNGKFIRQIGHEGRGPQEYQYIGALACDTISQKLYISCHKKILCYSFDGSYIRTITLKKFVDFMTIVDDELWPVYSNFAIPIKDKFITEVNILKLSKDGMVKDSVRIKTIKLDQSIFSSYPYVNYLSQCAKATYLYCPVLLPEPITRDTLYTLKGDKLIPAVKLDFGKAALQTGKKKNLLIKNIYRTDQHLFAEYRYNMKEKFFFYDLKNERNGSINDDVWGMGNTTLRPLDLKHNLMYFTKYGYELEGIIDGVNENSNPVLMVVKMKS